MPEESPFIENESDAKVEVYEQPKKKLFSKEKIKTFSKWFFHVDVKDIWNWVLLALAIVIFWWAIRQIIRAMSIS